MSSDYVDLVTTEGMNRRLGEIQADIEGARDAALGAARNVDGLLSQIGEALETTTDARDRILEVLPAAQAAADAAPAAIEAASHLPAITNALDTITAAQQVATGVSGTPYVGTASGVPITGLLVAPGPALLVQPAAMVADNLLITGISIGGIV